MEPLLSGLSTFFSWLMDYTIDITILICLIFIIKSIAAKKLPAWWHYSLWIILLLRMITPLKFESPFNIPNVVPITIDESLFESILLDEEFIMSRFAAELSSNPHGPQGWNIQVDDVLLVLWLAGAVFLGMYILIKNIKFWNSIKKVPLLTEKKVLNLLEECKSIMNSHSLLKITLTDKVKSPALFGYIRPRLLLPVGILEKLNDAELSYIFLHELGHLKRHDIGVSWIIAFLQIFQWFNPFVWLAFHRMRIDQESACDASVLSRIKHNQTIDYASTIVGFLENFYRNRKLPALVGILENQTQIKKRITMIIRYRKNSKMMMCFSTTLLFIIGVILFSLAGFAEVKHERSVSDSSKLPYQFEVKMDLATQDNYIKYEKEMMRLLEKIHMTSIAAQDRGVKDIMKQEKFNLDTQVPAEIQDENKKETVRFNDDTQKDSVVAQDRTVKDGIDLEKQNLQSQIAQVENQNANIKDEKRAVKLSESNQKAPEKSSNILSWGNKTISDNFDILKYYEYMIYESQKSAETTQLVEKINNTHEEKSMKYMELTDSANSKSGNLHDAKATPDFIEDKHSDGEIYSLKGVDEYPKIVSVYTPRYPFEARAKGIEGRVILRFVVDRAGNVQDPEVVSAEPEGIFEQAALDAVIKYRIKPAMKDGKGVSSVVKLPINFAMHGKYLRLAQR